LVLISGLLSAVIGGALLLLSNQVDGLIWYAIPVITLGFVLCGIWLGSVLRRGK
jgi:hypothetical protein